MKIFVVEIDNITYDEFDEFAVVAENAEQAKKEVFEMLDDDQLERIENGIETVEINEVDLTTKGVFCSSFCAG